MNHRKRSTKWPFRESCFLELGNCIFSPLINTLNGDALYSRSDPSDLDMVMIEAKPPWYEDRDSCSDSSCSEKDDLEALASFSDTRIIELYLETHETLKRNLRTKKELTGIRLRWDMAPGIQNVRILHRCHVMI